MSKKGVETLGVPMWCSWQLPLAWILSILDMHTLSLSFGVRLETSRRCSWAWVCFRTAVVARESARYELVCLQKLKIKVRRAVLIPTWKEKNLSATVPGHGGPSFSRSVCVAAIPVKQRALGMKMITFMGWDDWYFAPACV